MRKPETNRAKQLSIDKKYVKGVKLIDIDTTIAQYMANVVIPDVEENGTAVKAPLLYGNAERWNNARKDGYLRDKRGKIQIPLVMFKRNSIERDTSLSQFKEVNTLPAYIKYSPKHKYDRFSVVSGASRPYEQYFVSVPHYVTISYEVMIWTSFTEHMNKIVESYQYATDRYWGEEDGFKFRVRIDSFDNQQEVGEGSERIIRTSFTMTVNAYLLPEMHDEEPTVKKSFTPKRVLFGVETDLTGNLFTNPNIYNDYEYLMDFVAIRGSDLAIYDTYSNGVSAYLENVSLPILPKGLVGIYDTKNWFAVYINGTFIPSNIYKYTYDSDLKRIYFTFDLSKLSEPGGSTPNKLDAFDEIVITGKFEKI